MDICVLTHQEVGRLVNWGINPCHSQHRHAPLAKVLRRIDKSEMRLVEVDTADGSFCVVLSESNFYELRKKSSWGFMTMQLVNPAH